MRTVRQAAPPLVFGLLVLAAWMMVAAAGAVPSFVLPSPIDVAARVVTDARQGMIWGYLAPTLMESLLGSLLAACVAVPLGYVVAHSRLVARTLEPYIALTQAIPLVAIAPLLVIWVGYGTVPIALLCAIIAFFPMVTTSVLGFRQLNPHLIEAAGLDGAWGASRLVHIELPLAAPAIVAGIRAGVVLSVTGAIVGEFVMGGEGLGTLLTLTRDQADSVGLFAVLVWISAAALLLNAAIAWLERLVNRHLDGESHA